jgi:hypothetical protein
MTNFVLTVFAKDGEKLLEKSFQATSEKEAKLLGEELLKENKYEAYTSRVTSSTGKLILFNR